MEEGTVVDENSIGEPRSLGRPQVDASAFVAPGAVLVGDVRVLRGASVWYGCVLRGDLAHVLVGEDTNVQDGCVLHVDEGRPCVLGARVTVGHGAVVHAAEVSDDCLIGMGAIVLSGSKIGRGSIVDAGAVVPEGMDVSPGAVVAGVPARMRRQITDRDRARIDEAWRTYARLAALHSRR